MARSIWNGAVAFGLVRVPVKVHSATEDKSVHFHQVHLPDGARIKHKRICSKEGKEVPYEEVAKGYETSSGKYVLLDQEEIDAASGERSRLIDIDEFVCGGDIDPVYFDRTYHLGAGEDGKAPYRLLHDALERTDRVGLGRWVFHNREYLVAVRTIEGGLALHTMRFAAELVRAKDLPIGKPKHKPGKREIEMAGKLVESLHGDFRPQDFKDTHRKAVLALVKRKASGKKIEVPEREEPEASDDLAAALEAALEKV
jgi:DNA end-binding protein Ku